MPFSCHCLCGALPRVEKAACAEAGEFACGDFVLLDAAHGVQGPRPLHGLHRSPPLPLDVLRGHKVEGAEEVLASLFGLFVELTSTAELEQLPCTADGSSACLHSTAGIVLNYSTFPIGWTLPMSGSHVRFR